MHQLTSSSVDSQKEHWKYHKHYCKAPPAPNKGTGDTPQASSSAAAEPKPKKEKKNKVKPANEMEASGTAVEGAALTGLEEVD